jgi:type II secretory pathway pseudopilin PulG
MKRAFTVLELVIATLIFLMIMGATLTVFFGTNREYDTIAKDLEVNKDVVDALDKIGRDVRESSLIELPPLLPVSLSPPPFAHKSPQTSTGLLVLVHEKPSINASGRGLAALRERVVWYLDRPKRIGAAAGGGEVTTYALFRGVEPPPPAPPAKPEQVLANVSELVMWRTFRDPGLGPDGAGTGPSVVHVQLKIAHARTRADRKLTSGYVVQFTTSYAARGKDIASRRGVLGGVQP